MKKKIETVIFRATCYNIMEENIDQAEKNFEYIAQFITDKIQELKPDFCPKIYIEKTYIFQEDKK